jgi:hypothetical protein
VDHIPSTDVRLRQDICYGKIPDDLVVTSGRATFRAVYPMLDLMTSAPAPNGVGPSSLPVEV